MHSSTPLYNPSTAVRPVATAKEFIPFLLWLVWHQLWHLCLACTTRFVNKSTPFQFINGDILKSRKTCLTNHTGPISCHWLLMPSRRMHIHTTHAHTQTHTRQHASKNNFKKPGIRGLRPHTLDFNKSINI